MWQPEIEPIAYAATRSERPNAMATPRTPTEAPVLSSKAPVASTAVPGPPTTRIMVPTASARAMRADLFMMPTPPESAAPPGAQCTDPSRGVRGFRAPLGPGSAAGPGRHPAVTAPTRGVPHPEG